MVNPYTPSHVSAALIAAFIGVGAPLQAAQGSPRWAAAVTAGVVDQDAIGGAPTIALELEGRLTPVLAIGVRSGYFGKEDGGGETRDTLYGVVFARVRWPREHVRPFAEVGGGPYRFEGDTEDGWFGGIGLDVLFSSTHHWLQVAARYHSVTRPEDGPLPDFVEVQAGFRFGF